MIERHIVKINRERQLRRYVDRVADLPVSLQNFSKNPSGFGWQVNDKLELLSQSLYYLRSKSESFSHLFYANQFGLNHFKLATNDGKPVQLMIGETPVQTTGKATRDYIDLGSWMRVFMLSAILRDREAITFLLGISNDFMKQGVISFDDLRIAEVELLRCLGNDMREINEAIKSYWDAEGKLSQKDPSRDWIDNSSIPMVKVIFALANRNQALFDKELEDALITHKNYFGNESAQSSSWGWISFPLLTVCAYAYDRRMKINIESDYIPRWMVEGDFNDCELTAK